MIEEKIDHATAPHFYDYVPSNGEFKARVYVLETDGTERVLYISGPWNSADIALTMARDWCSTNDREAQPAPTVKSKALPRNRTH